MTPEIRSSYVEVCVFRRTAAGPQFLILRRSEEERIYPGLWQNVTGSIEDGETALGAAQREVREETGHDPVRLWVIPFVNSFYVPRKDMIMLTPFFAAEVHPEAETVLSGEHSEYAWLGYDEALLRLVWPGQKRGIQLVLSEIISGNQSGMLLEI